MVEQRDLEVSEIGIEPMGGHRLVGYLNSILEVERAGTRVLSALMARGAPGANALLAEVQRDQACNCAVLTRMVRRLGGAPSMAVGSFRDRVLAQETLEDRLELLNQGHAWLARRLDHIVPHVTDAGIRSALGQIRDTHRANIAACDVLLDGLTDLLDED